MVRSKGKGDKQLGRGESSRGRGRGKIKLIPQVREAIRATRKEIRAADRAASHSSGNEYEPSGEASDSDSVPEYIDDFPERFRLTDKPTPQGSPTARAPVHVSSESSKGSAASSDKEYSTSPTASLSGEGPVEKEREGGGGEPQVGGVERTQNPEAWQDRFVSEVAYHKFREWWPERKLILERSFVDRDLLPHNPNPPSTSADMPPGPSTSTAPDIPSTSTYPLTAHRLSQALVSINKWMQTASSKLSKKLLENQKLITEAIDSHGKALKELAKEAKKMKKTRASKESVKRLRVEVDRLKTDQLPLDLILHEPAPAAQPQPEQELERPPKRRRVIPCSDDAIKQLEDPQGDSSSQPQESTQDSVQVQAQVPVEPQATGSQSQVPEQTEDPGTQTQDPIRTEDP
ncbi:PREDICTED: uncharacterized protein LOC109237369 [Nicotiana attenuata]|uniref:uncharacterized protein LOC109237369 n=1 Tax=Nicotiana attenuata TaxID=49451 RepID=UPI000905CB22|nr:PREDICTED: uncharacterized protein LOC109237369 [Nicotiana attenuata]